MVVVVRQRERKRDHIERPLRCFDPDDDSVLVFCRHTSKTTAFHSICLHLLLQFQHKDLEYMLWIWNVIWNEMMLYLDVKNYSSDSSNYHLTPSPLYSLFPGSVHILLIRRMKYIVLFCFAAASLSEWKKRNVLLGGVHMPNSFTTFWLHFPRRYTTKLRSSWSVRSDSHVSTRGHVSVLGCHPTVGTTHKEVEEDDVYHHRKNCLDEAYNANQPPNQAIDASYAFKLQSRSRIAAWVASDRCWIIFHELSTPASVHASRDGLTRTMAHTKTGV